MKNKAIFIGVIFSLLFPSAHAQFLLDRETQMFRDGDMIEKRELEHKSPGRCGQNVVWNFCELEILDDGKPTSFAVLSDTAFFKISPRSTYEYRLQGDTLLCVGYSTPLLQMRYLLPETHRVFPVCYGDSVSSLYYGEGIQPYPPHGGLQDI